MLLFDDDLQARQQTTALFLEAQARLGLGQTAAARRLLRARAAARSQSRSRRRPIVVMTPDHSNTSVAEAMST